MSEGMRIMRHTLWLVTAVAVAALIAVAALAFALISVTKANDAAREAKQAAMRANEISQCINDILGTRNAPNEADQRAHLAFAQAVAGLFDLPPGASQSQQLGELAKFKAQVADFERTLLGDEKIRAEHPLGHC